MNRAREKEENFEGHAKIKSLSTGSIGFQKGKRNVFVGRWPSECPSSFHPILFTLKSKIYSLFLTWLTLPLWTNLFGIHFSLSFRINFNSLAVVCTLQHAYLCCFPDCFPTHRHSSLGQPCSLSGNSICVPCDSGAGAFLLPGIFLPHFHSIYLAHSLPLAL